MIRESENHTHTRPRLQRCRRLSATCLSPHPHGLATKRASVRAAFSAMTAWETQSTDLLFLSMRPGTCSDSNMALSADICLQTFSLSLSLARPLSLSLSLSLCVCVCVCACVCLRTGTACTLKYVVSSSACRALPRGISWAFSYSNDLKKVLTVCPVCSGLRFT